MTKTIYIKIVSICLFYIKKLWFNLIIIKADVKKKLHAFLV